MQRLLEQPWQNMYNEQHDNTHCGIRKHTKITTGNHWYSYKLRMRRTAATTTTSQLADDVTFSLESLLLQPLSLFLLGDGALDLRDRLL